MTHYMKLHLQPFEMIKSGEKTIELRLNDEKRRLLCVGDEIVFTNRNDETLKVKIVKIHKFSDFAELYNALPLLKCGYKPNELENASHSDMEAYYSTEQQAKYGVLGIEIMLT